MKKYYLFQDEVTELEIIHEYEEQIVVKSDKFGLFIMELGEMYNDYKSAHKVLVTRIENRIERLKFQLSASESKLLELKK